MTSEAHQRRLAAMDSARLVLEDCLVQYREEMTASDPEMMRSNLVQLGLVSKHLEQTVRAARSLEIECYLLSEPNRKRGQGDGTE